MLKFVTVARLIDNGSNTEHPVPSLLYYPISLAYALYWMIAQLSQYTVEYKNYNQDSALIYSKNTVGLLQKEEIIPKIKFRV